MADVREVSKNGVPYLYANNLMIENAPVRTNSFKFRYKNPKNEKVYEDKIVPYFIEEQDKKILEDHKLAVHQLWFALSERLKKAKPEEDINIFQMINRPNFKGRVRQESEPPQLRLLFSSEIPSRIDSLADMLEQKGLIKEAYVLDLLNNFYEGWKTNQATIFFDEMQNKEIDAEDAIKVLSAYQSSDDRIDSVAKKSGIEPAICLEIIKIGKKSGLL